MAQALYEDQTHVLPTVDVPTLLLYADHDTRAPVTIGESMRAVVPRSRLVVLAGPGHVSPVEAPDEVSAELQRFLGTVDEPG